MTRDQYLAAHLRRIQASHILHENEELDNLIARRLIAEAIVTVNSRKQYLEELREDLNSRVPPCPRSARRETDTRASKLPVLHCDVCGFTLLHKREMGIPAS
jgi:hypothetical protein